MTGWRSALLLLVAGVGLAAGTASPATAEGRRPVPHQRLFAFTDPDIIESSGLVDRGRRVFTINDSGDGPVVYGVDPGTGDTVSRTTYSSDGVEDVEAIAPGADGSVWVGDIGDNRSSRRDVSVYRVGTLPPGDATVPGRRYRLSYPDGPGDAETLLVQPRTQRVFVVSKSVFGGTVYAAPRRLDPGRDNALRVVARVDGLVTDGTFLPDGRHVLLRTYGTASVYTFPDFRLLGTVRLPSQRQGEGISVGADGRVLVSSEGVRAPVLEVSLPRALADSRDEAVPASPPGPAPGTRRPSPVAHPQAPARDAWDWGKIALVVVAVAGLGVWTARLSRVRSR